MFKTDSFLVNKKLSLNQNVWHDHATCAVCQLYICRAFLLSTPTFSFSTPVENSEATWKKPTKCNKNNWDLEA